MRWRAIRSVFWLLDAQPDWGLTQAPTMKEDHNGANLRPSVGIQASWPSLENASPEQIRELTLEFRKVIRALRNSMLNEASLEPLSPCDRSVFC